MAKHTGKHTAKRSKAAGVAAFLVLMFSGFLLATNLRVNRSVVVTNDTAELVEQRVKKSTPADGSRRAQLPRERSEQNPEQPGRRRPARQRKRRQRHHAARGGRPRTRGDARRFATLGKHGRFQRLHLQHQRLRGAPARRRSRGERALGGRRGIHDDHGPACAVQFRSALFRQRAAFAGQKVFAAIHHFRDRPGRDNEKGARQFAGSDHIPAVRQRVRQDGRSTKKKNSISTRPTHCNSRCNTRRR